MNCTVEKITPEIAKEWLTNHNKHNYRKISRQRVRQFSGMMTAGLWELNGEAIVFDTDGELKNGQHRLSAIVESGVTCEMVVIRGVSPDIKTYDQGSKRSYGQMARASGLTGEVALATMAAVAKVILSEGKFHTARLTISDAEALDYVLNHEDFMRKLTKITHSKRTNNKNPLTFRKGIIVGVMTAILCCGVTDEDAHAFCNVVCTGFPCEYKESTSAIVLRNYLLNIYGRSDDDIDIYLCSATIDALSDFSKDNPRQRPYKLNQRNYHLLKSACKMARDDV